MCEFGGEATKPLRAFEPAAGSAAGLSLPSDVSAPPSLFHGFSLRSAPRRTQDCFLLRCKTKNFGRCFRNYPQEQAVCDPKPWSGPQRATLIALLTACLFRRAPCPAVPFLDGLRYVGCALNNKFPKHAGKFLRKDIGYAPAGPLLPYLFCTTKKLSL